MVKSRQLGITETISSFMLWRALTNEGYLGLIISKSQSDSSLIARRMRRMINSVGVVTKTDNLCDIEFLNGGRILFRNSQPDSCRGIESVVDVFLDEFAFLDYAKEVFNALAPSQQLVGDKARIFAVSTPNGKAGFYYDLLTGNNGDNDLELACESVVKGELAPFYYWIDKGNWCKVLIHWKAHPVYRQTTDFLERIRSNQKLSDDVINREYNLSFQEAESAFFPFEIVRDNVSEYLSTDDEGYNFIGIDAATTGEDYATCVVVNRGIDGVFKVVETYRKRQQTSEYHLFKIGEMIERFNPLAVGIEVTGGVGQVWFEKLINLHFSTKIKRIVTTQESKLIMVEKLKFLLECGKLKIKAGNPLIDELLSFKRSGSKLTASVGKHDDLVMGCAFSITACEFL